MPKYDDRFTVPCQRCAAVVDQDHFVSVELDFSPMPEGMDLGFPELILCEPCAGEVARAFHVALGPGTWGRAQAWEEAEAQKQKEAKRARLSR